ncbi:MAG: helix-turn-helix domain-containing protein [Bacilli bacterium]|nr:helix-turn-helix domain-containing protein [Bacilli bacterium]
MTKREIIAKNILTLRKKNNLTQAGLAEKLCYSDKAISKWERAESLPDAEMLYNIAELFNVEIGYLFEEHSEEDNVVETEEEKKKYQKRELHAKIVFASALIIIIFTMFAVVVVNTLSALGIPVTGLAIYYILSAIPSLFLIFELVTGMKFMIGAVFSVTMWTWANSACMMLSFISKKPNEYVWIYALAMLFQILLIIYPRLTRGAGKNKKRNKDAV